MKPSGRTACLLTLKIIQQQYFFPKQRLCDTGIEYIGGYFRVTISNNYFLNLSLLSNQIRL